MITGMFLLAARLAVVGEEGLLPAHYLLNNWQRRYAYRLLAAPQSQPTRNILTAILRENEEQVQPGELADGDDNWFKPLG